MAAHVAAERARDPESAAVEFDAQFRAAGATAYFDPRLIDDAVEDYPIPLEKPALSAGRVFCADFGFRLDSSALVAMTNRTAEVRVGIVDEVAPTANAPLVPSIVVSRFAKHILSWDGDHIMCDGTYLESVRELAWSVGLNVHELPSGQPGKVEQHLACRELLAERKLKIPRHPRLIAQLKAIQVAPTPGGGLRIFTPRRRGLAHGDVASAFVGSAWSSRRARVSARQAAALRAQAQRVEAIGAFLRGDVSMAEVEEQQRQLAVLRMRDVRSSIDNDPAWVERQRREHDEYLNSIGSPAGSKYVAPGPTDEEKARNEDIEARAARRLAGGSK